MMENFEEGQQVIRVPDHAEGDIDHPDCERGFVEFDEEEYCYVRYWHRDNPIELRTKANSEMTYKRHLIKKKYAPQVQIDEALKWCRQKRFEERMDRVGSSGLFPYIREIGE